MTLPYGFQSLLHSKLQLIVTAEDGSALHTGQRAVNDQRAAVSVSDVILCLAPGTGDVVGAGQKAETREKQRDAGKSQQHTKPGNSGCRQGGGNQQNNAEYHQNRPCGEGIGCFHDDTSLIKEYHRRNSGSTEKQGFPLEKT